MPGLRSRSFTSRSAPSIQHAVRAWSRLRSEELPPFRTKALNRPSGVRSAQADEDPQRHGQFRPGHSRKPTSPGYFLHPRHARIRAIRSFGVRGLPGMEKAYEGRQAAEGGCGSGRHLLTLALPEACCREHRAFCTLRIHPPLVPATSGSEGRPRSSRCARRGGKAGDRGVRRGATLASLFDVIADPEQVPTLQAGRRDGGSGAWGGDRIFSLTSLRAVPSSLRHCEPSRAGAREGVAIAPPVRCDCHVGPRFARTSSQGRRRKSAARPSTAPRAGRA